MRWRDIGRSVIKLFEAPVGSQGHRRPVRPTILAYQWQIYQAKKQWPGHQPEPFPAPFWTTNGQALLALAELHRRDKRERYGATAIVQED